MGNRPVAIEENTEPHAPRRRPLLRGSGKTAGPRRPVRRGAALALGVATAAALAWSVWDQRFPGTASALLAQTAINALIAIAAAGLVTGLLFVTVGRFKALPWAYLWTLLACTVLLVTLGAGASRIGWFAAIAVIAVGTSLLGGALGGLSPHAGREPVRARDRRILALALSLVLLAAPTVWLLTATQGTPAPAEDGTASTVIEEDPAAPGPFETAAIAYGSGSDERERYGDSADLTTPTVDASPLVTGWDDARESLWGFDIEHLPLNGMVWYPRGEGPFPLVLIVHGNKSGAVASEEGFEYLGELLAGHGFIAVSVDQNFFNTGPLDRSGGLTGVNLARGWLLLEHLRVWDEWNRGSGTPFADRVDMERIGLIGHSRGGEAIAVAAHLNALDTDSGEEPPDLDPSLFGHGFGIRSLLALAPAEGQYVPQSGPIRLEDVNYLAIQGSHDADVTGFGGLDQYERVSFTGAEPFVKAALYVGRANHGHFNSGWGDHDVGNGIPKLFLDTETLMAPEDQRRVAAVYASSFLRATLADDASYLGLLQDHRAASAFLPETDYVSQFTGSGDTVVEESAVSVEGFAEAERIALPLRNGPGEDSVHSLAWEDDGREPILTAALDAGASTDPPSHVVFDAVAVTEGEELADAIGVRLTDGSGRTAELRLAATMPLRHLLSAQYLKAGWMHESALTQPVLQSYRLPLSDFEAVEADFDAADLRSVSLVFDGAASGSVLVDDLGIA